MSMHMSALTPLLANHATVIHMWKSYLCVCVCRLIRKYDAPSPKGYSLVCFLSQNHVNTLLSFKNLLHAYIHTKERTTHDFELKLYLILNLNQTAEHVELICSEFSFPSIEIYISMVSKSNAFWRSYDITWNNMILLCYSH